MNDADSPSHPDGRALRLPAQEVGTATAEWTPLVAGEVLAAAVVGVGLVLALDRYTDDLEH